MADKADEAEKDDVDLVTIVLPHNLHAPVAVECLKAGKHVIVEKPMCISIAEGTEMINTAKENNVMITVYHNRRWDADFWTLKELVESGVIGKIFHVEMWGGGYGRPNPDWWRSSMSIVYSTRPIGVPSRRVQADSSG